jgi:hypothetical protein
MVNEAQLIVDDVDWEDPALRRWLDTITRKSTKHLDNRDYSRSIREAFFSSNS